MMIRLSAVQEFVQFGRAVGCDVVVLESAVTSMLAL